MNGGKNEVVCYPSLMQGDEGIKRKRRGGKSGVSGKTKRFLFVDLA